MSYLSREKAFIPIDKELLKQQKYDGNDPLLLSCIKYNQNVFGEWTTDINSIVRKLGYVPDRHKGAINDKTKEQIKILSENKKISIDVADIEATPHNQPFTISTADSDVFEIEYGEDDKANPFIKFTYKEYSTITDFKGRNQNQKGNITRVFIQYKSYMNMSELTSKFAYPTIDVVAKQCAISKDIVATAIEHLEELELLHKHITGSFVPLKGKTAGVRQNAPNVYSIDPFDAAAHKAANETMLNWARGKSDWGLEKLQKFDEVSYPQMGKKKKAMARQRIIHEQEGYEVQQQILKKNYPGKFNFDDPTVDAADTVTKSYFATESKSDVWGEPPPTSNEVLVVDSADVPALFDEAEPVSKDDEDVDQVLADDLNYFENVEDLRKKEKDAEIKYFKDICTYLKKNVFSNNLESNHMHHLLDQVTKFFKSDSFDGGKDKDSIHAFYKHQAMEFRDHLVCKNDEDYEVPFWKEFRDRKLYEIDEMIDFWNNALTEDTQKEAANI